MTPDEIIEMTREAGWSGIYSSWTNPTNRTSLTVPVTMQQIEAFTNLVAAKAASKEREACAELVWPKLKIWTEEEQTAMGLAFNQSQEKHGWYETLMAVGASVLKMKAAAIRARGEQA